MLGEEYTLEAVGNYLVLYCVIGKVMEVRRFVYAPSNWRMTMSHSNAATVNKA